jgi:Leucine rich repeat
LLFILICVNGQQIECENVQTHKEDGEVTEVCRIDASTVINTFNFTIGSEIDVNMEEIYAKNNDRIRYLPKNIYEKFPNLKILNFETCSLKAVAKENVQKLTYMKKIDFAYNRIITISKETFEDLVNLEYLDLSYNKISRISGDVFILLDKLRLLNFDGNFCITDNFINDDLDMKKVAESVSQKCLVLEKYQTCQEELRVSEKIKENCECSLTQGPTQGK